MTRNCVSGLRLMIFVAMMVMFSFPSSASQPIYAPKAVKGILDLRTTKFNNTPINLNGEWTFYWKQLKKTSRSDIYHEYENFPELWSNVLWKGKPISSQGFATYEVKILLPKERDQLAFKIPDMYSAYALYINGKLIARNGTPGTSKETTTPYWSTQVKPFLAKDTLNLKLFISNFHHSKGGISKPIQLGLFNELQDNTNLDHAFDFLLTGCMLMGGLYFLGLYLLGRHDKSTLYFSLFCFFYSYRIVGAGDYTLHTIFPYMGWQLAIHLEYISLFMAVAMFALYTLYLYPKDTPTKILFGMIGVCFAFALITTLSPPILFTQLMNPFIALLIPYIFFAIYIYWTAYRNNRIGAKYALLSTIAIFIIIITLILAYYDIAYPQELLLFAGYLVFFFCQSLILSFRFAFTLKKAKEDAEVGLKVKSEFLSTMSHEIRTPLNAVIGMTHLMMKEDPRPDQKSHLDVMLFSAKNLLTIVNDILDFSTIEEGKMQFLSIPIDIQDLVHKIVSVHNVSAKELNIDLFAELDKALPKTIIGDPTRITQVVGNLVQNAIKFTKSGWVKIKIDVVSKTEKEITLKIAVEDTGIGIPPDKQKIIFERFTQIDSSTSRVFGGTGLGLSVSKHMLALQGSELLLESEEGKGSTFYFIQTFPIPDEPEIVKPKQTNEPEEKPLQDLCVLIVEDNRMNVLVIKSFLKRWGAISDIAVNGLEALEKLDATRHQIVLMDLHMPVLDGYEATKQLRERGETLPIVAVTASLAQDSKSKMFEIGMSDIISKPIDPEKLLGVIIEQTKIKKTDEKDSHSSGNY
ncbi:ATP-binding protein [Dyadobacter sp. CY356]|uniref:ATP-binding protein n=1 Tax=Dyadobacter sp. CY356 TaxID=2906442 RepID=UPI001F378770|nr:ATP-binding protein [Dyadobacter sp. CY356]MCF0058300.1 ATP-binding protein [Dyadobacter sp. CY356]